MLRMARAARSPVPTMTTGSFHQAQRRAMSETKARPMGTAPRLSPSAIANVTRE
jgi:hypothetical protein